MTLKGHFQLLGRATWTLLFPVWKAITTTPNQMNTSDTSRNPLQFCLVFHSISDFFLQTSFWANIYSSWVEKKIGVTLIVEWTTFSLHTIQRGQAAEYVYGTKYEVGQYSDGPFKRNLHNRDAPCIVSFVKSRGSMLMMPAKNECPS